MVLKRLLVTALGALGLGALAVGTAQAQVFEGDGQIPAPDIFNDQITCSQNVPTMNPTPSVTPMGAMTSPLDDIIGMGTNLLNADGLSSVTNGAATLANLSFVIPAAVANCGRTAATQPGTMTGQLAANPFNAATTGTGDNENLGEGAVATDVAEGYADLLTKFTVVYGNPADNASTGTAGALATAEKNLADELKKTTPNETVVTQLTNAVTTAQTAHNKALAAYNAVSAGPIHQAGAAEWMAQAAVVKSVVDYNAQVTKTNTAKSTLDGKAYFTYAANTGVQGRSKYVPLGNNELITGDTAVVTIADGMGTVNHDQLTQYTNADLNAPQIGIAAIAGNADDVDGTNSDTSASNFDAAGKLITPMENWDHDNDTSTPRVLRNTVSDTNTVAAIRTTVENVRIATAALKKARDEHTGLNQAIYDEAHRRAKLEQDYYDALWAKVLADTDDRRTATQRLQYVDDNGNGVNDPGETTPNTDYVKNPNTIAAANTTHIEESNKRVSAEADLRTAVAARETATQAVVDQFTGPQAFYAQLVARREALKAAADKVVAGATTPTKAQTDAAEAAAKALETAKTSKADFDALYADPDNPTVALIDELVKSDGDDGQLLVDAITSNYNTAKKVAEDVAGLTGEGGDVAKNTAAIAENAGDIADNTKMIGENRGMIMTNAENIDSNTKMIGENRTMIETNADDILENAGNIAMNASDIVENRGMIDANVSAIGANTSAISGLDNRVGANASAIQRNSGMIGELSESLETVRAGVAASMALAGMPAINGRGISIGVGSFDGESAFAVGFMIQSEMASFKVGVTSAGGETGASAGVGFQF